MSNFFWTTTKYATDAQADEINAAVQAIDPDVSFVTISQPGNTLRGWLERPNDTTNNYNATLSRNARCVEAAERVLA